MNKITKETVPAKKVAYNRDASGARVPRTKPLMVAPKDLRPHPLLGRAGMLHDLINREIAKGNKDGEKRQSHKDKAEALAEELAGIRESIRESGIKDAIKVCKTASGKWLILDGRHRCELAKELGLELVPCQECPESEARAIIMDAAVRRHISKGARAYQAVTFYPEMAARAQGKRTDLSTSSVSGEVLASKIGVSTTTMETAIWLFKTFAEREDIRVEFEPSIFAGNSLDKIKGAVQAWLNGKEVQEDEKKPKDPANSKFINYQDGLNRLTDTWEIWGQLKERDRESALIMLQKSVKKAPAAVREALVKSLTEQGEEE